MDQVFNQSSLEAIQKFYAYYVFAPVLLGALFWRRLTKTQILVFCIGLLSAINSTATVILSNFDIRNVWVYHIYVPILFWLTWKIYKDELKALLSKRAFNIFLSLALIFFIVNTISIQGTDKIPTNAIFAISGFFIFWSVSYFYSLLRQTQYRSLEREPLFWFNTGVLLYYSSTIVIFLLVFNFLVNDSEATYIAIILNALFNLVLVTAYVISIWVKPPQ